VVLLSPTAVFFLPGRSWNRAAIQSRYVTNLRSYQGTPYVYGGEGTFGIDCSGLPRRAYRDALMAEGLRTVNGSLIRAWLDQWWHDAGASAMGQGAEGRLVPIVGGLDSRDTLEPGDVAVVNGDTHVVVFLGDGQWAEADPDAAKVLFHDEKTEGVAFLGASPKYFRWRELTE
jgi:cell wall-associated NlpC family hydrolase